MPLLLLLRPRQAGVTRSAGTAGRPSAGTAAHDCLKVAAVSVQGVTPTLATVVLCNAHHVLILRQRLRD